MKRLFLAVCLAGALITPVVVDASIPADWDVPSIRPGETLDDLQNETNEAIAVYRRTYANVPGIEKVMTAFEQNYREAARLYKLYITNPTPNILKAYNDAKNTSLSDMDKIERMSKPYGIAVNK